MATELGKAYVQIMPSARGISGKLKNVIEPEAEVAAKSAGFKMGGLIKKAIVAAGIGLAIKSAIDEGAQLQQSIGGIETLFKDTADVVRKYADEAYKTAGLSANEYMKSVTSFSASLLQSMGGDTDKAAKVANRAMIDMSDNANKMGTNMGDIQNAYQGFAKQNYTMLDNLKLGYGGTKTEMQRLLKDAQELSGVKYDINNLSDVYTAIGIVQDQLGITGTTAREAEATLSGSLNAMQSSFRNVLGNLTLGEDVTPSLRALAQTMSTFLFKNFIPMVGNIIGALPSAIVTFFTTAIPLFVEQGGLIINGLTQGFTQSMPSIVASISSILNGIVLWIQESLPGIMQSGVTLISNFATGIFNAMPLAVTTFGEILNKILIALMEAIPTIMESGVQLIGNMAQGLKNNIPAITEAIVNVLDNLLKTIIEKYPEYLKKGWEIIGKLAKGIWDNLPLIIRTLTDLIVKLLGKIREYLPQFIAKGLELIGQLAVGLIKAIPGLVAKIPEIVGALIDAFFELRGAFGDIGGDIISGLWNGIINMKDWLLGKVRGFASSILDGFKDFFGIHSPSRVMEKDVGKWLPAGVAVGIEGNTKPLLKTMENLGALTVDSFNPDLSFNSKSTVSTFNGGIDDKLESVLTGLDELLDRLEKNSKDSDNKMVDSIVKSFAILAGNMQVQLDKRSLGKVILDLSRNGYSL